MFTVKYLKYLVRHKWYVFVECKKLGVPFLGIVHDLSKFHPEEFFRSASRYYGDHADDKAEKQALQEYKKSWLHHQRHNKHHWQYWVVYIPRSNDNWTSEWGCLAMPDRYRREMVADWRGSGITFGDPDTKAWYMSHKETILLHPETRAWVEKELAI